MPNNQSASMDFEVIKPRVDLRAKVRDRIGSAANVDPVAAAEQAMQQLSTRFTIWMDEQINMMVDGWNSLKSDGYGEEAVQAFRRCVHDIKGEASTFGYPLAGEAAASLAHLFEHVSEPGDWPPKLVEQYVNSIRAMVVEHDRNDYDKTAKTLCDQLAAVTEDYIAAYQAKPQ